MRKLVTRCAHRKGNVSPTDTGILYPELQEAAVIINNGRLSGISIALRGERDALSSRSGDRFARHYPDCEIGR